MWTHNDPPWFFYALTVVALVASCYLAYWTISGKRHYPLTSSIEYCRDISIKSCLQADVATWVGMRNDDKNTDLTKLYQGRYADCLSISELVCKEE